MKIPTRWVQLIAGITGMVWYEFRSLPLGLMSLIPNVFPNVLVVGLMGWIGLPVRTLVEIAYETADSASSSSPTGRRERVFADSARMVGIPSITNICLRSGSELK